MAEENQPTSTLSLGWIKLWRKLLPDALWQSSTPEQKTILITLLLMANHEENEWVWKGAKFTANPGQMITSLTSICEKAGAGISIQNVRTAIKRFRKLGFLKNHSTNTGRKITICNWERYQLQPHDITELLTKYQQSDSRDITELLTKYQQSDSLDTERKSEVEKESPNNQTNRELTKYQQSGNKALTTNKNDKNDKNDKKRARAHAAENSNKYNQNAPTKNGNLNYSVIKKLWNSRSPNSLSIKAITRGRKENLHDRYKEKDFSLGKIIEAIQEQPFLLGENEHGWIVDFDWIIKDDDNYVKILERQYKKNTTKSRRVKDFGI